MKFIVAISELQDSDEGRLMQDFAAQLTGKNTISIPSFDALQAGGGSFMKEAITNFRPSQPLLG